MKRIKYLAAFIAIVIVEVLIALFVHDAFVRPYLGDVLVVIALYCLARTFIPEGCKLLSLYVFLFAAGVELLQLFNFVELLGLGGSRFFRVLLGSVFDVKDILCYFVGCVITGVYEFALRSKRSGLSE